MKKIILATLLFFVFSLPCHATDYYIADGVQGAGNGESCATARNGVYNKPSEWNWSQVQAGDTVWLCGTFNVSRAAGTNIQVHKGGTSDANRVTVKMCSGAADCGAGTAATITGAVTWFMLYNTQPYVILDGNGQSITVTDVGTGKTGHGAASVAKGVYSNANYVDIKNFVISGMYVHTATPESYDSGLDAPNSVYGIKALGNYIKVYNNTISDTGCGIGAGGATNTNVEVYDNTVANSCWCFGTGNVKLHDNECTIGTNWWSLNGLDCHLNGLYAYGTEADTTAIALNVGVYNNYFHGPSSDPGYKYSLSRFAGVDYVNSSSVLKFYNNLIIPGPYWNTATPGVLNAGSTHILHPEVYNNTLDCTGGGTGTLFENGYISGAAENAYIKNNLVTGGCQLTTSVNAGQIPADSDNNLVYGNTGGIFATTTGEYHSYCLDTVCAGADQSWQSLLGDSCTGTLPNKTPAGNDCNSLTSDPLLTGLGLLGEGSPAIGAGQNLTSLCSSIPALCYDKAGVARPASGAWDIGAYQSGSAPEDDIPPVILSAEIAANGTTLTLTFSEAVTGSTGLALTVPNSTATLTYSSGSGTNTLVYTISRTTRQGDTVTLAATSSNIVDGASNGLTNFSNFVVTNNSTVTIPVMFPIFH